MQLPEFESEVVEFKEAISDASSIGHTFCAFANSNGGAIFIGISNTGKIIGVKNIDEVQRKIADLISQLKPMPRHNISIITENQKIILTASVQPLEKEVCFYHGRTWIRSGASNRLVEGSSLVSLLRERNIINFEDSISHATLDDLDLTKISKYLELRNNSISTPILTTLQNLKLCEGKKLKNLAVLFFARDVEKFVPQSSLKLVKFRGVLPVSIINADFYTGTILEVIERANNFVKANSAREFEIKDLQRVEKEEFPVAAVREAIINAVGHRDYFDKNTIQVSIFDDRIEITNPGGLLPGIKIEDLGSISKHRNNALYTLLLAAKLVEGIGTGIPRMINECRSQGVADPKFEELAGMFRTTIFNKRGTQVQLLSDAEKKALELVKNKKIVTATQVAREIKTSITTAISLLLKIEKMGYVKKTGHTKSSKYIFTG